MYLSEAYQISLIQTQKGDAMVRSVSLPINDEYAVKDLYQELSGIQDEFPGELSFCDALRITTTSPRASDALDSVLTKILPHPTA